jgi:hypothetical protein
MIFFVVVNVFERSTWSKHLDFTWLREPLERDIVQVHLTSQRTSKMKFELMLRLLWNGQHSNLFQKKKLWRQSYDPTSRRKIFYAIKSSKIPVIQRRSKDYLLFVIVTVLLLLLVWESVALCTNMYAKFILNKST